MTEDKELAAMKSMGDTLVGFDDAARERIIDYVNRRYLPNSKSVITSVRGLSGQPTDLNSFEDLASFYAAVSPRTDADRALVVAIWLQHKEGAKEWESMTVNSRLKDLGYGVSNITLALTTLQKRSPALVLQVQKSGSTQQARKKYKVTIAGMAAIGEMLKSPDAADHKS